jgi:hypothetical protein
MMDMLLLSAMKHTWHGCLLFTDTSSRNQTKTVLAGGGIHVSGKDDFTVDLEGELLVEAAYTLLSRRVRLELIPCPSAGAPVEGASRIFQTFQCGNLWSCDSGSGFLTCGEYAMVHETEVPFLSVWGKAGMDSDVTESRVLQKGPNGSFFIKTDGI